MSVPGTWRTARKPWRCVAADPIRSWTVKGVCEHGWSGSTARSEREVQETVARLQGRAHRPCHGGKIPTRWSVEVEARPNPEYRPDCLGDIPVGARYFEYRGEAGAYESGTRYCARCALAVWQERDLTALQERR